MTLNRSRGKFWGADSKLLDINIWPAAYGLRPVRLPGICFREVLCGPDVEQFRTPSALRQPEPIFERSKHKCKVLHINRLIANPVLNFHVEARENGCTF